MKRPWSTWPRRAGSTTPFTDSYRCQNNIPEWKCFGSIFGKCSSDKFLLWWPQPLLLPASPAPWSWGAVGNLHVHTGIASRCQGVLAGPAGSLLTPHCAAGREFGNACGSYRVPAMFVFLLPGLLKLSSGKGLML